MNSKLSIFNFQLTPHSQKSLVLSLSIFINFIVNCKLFWAFRQAVGLSAISLLAMFPSRSRIPFPKTNLVPVPKFRSPKPISSHSQIPSPNPVPKSRSRPQIPFPFPKSLAKDAAPIPNASEASELRLLAF